MSVSWDGVQGGEGLHLQPAASCRDIEAVVQRLTALSLAAPGFLLLLGASGYGKSSLLRAGVVPRLRNNRDRRWTVLKPFTPKGVPFMRLGEVLGEAYDASYTYGRGRKGAKFKQPWTNGSSGLVNRWGLAELHGQLFEWCVDLWNRDPRSAIQRPRGLFGGNRNAKAASMADGARGSAGPSSAGQH